jgi:hypothetical protein
MANPGLCVTTAMAANCLSYDAYDELLRCIANPRRVAAEVHQSAMHVFDLLDGDDRLQSSARDALLVQGHPLVHEALLLRARERRRGTLPRLP